MDCLQVKKRQKTVRTRGFVRLINTVHRRVIVEKQRSRSCPDNKRENRTKPRLCTVYSYGAPWRKTVLYGFAYGEWSRTVKKNVQRGTEPNRTAGYHSTEPHRRIYNN